MSLKISIPKPCHENWGAMSPDDKGRFCGQCAKTVVDFTAMPQHDVEYYLLANADKKVCGRFNGSQLDNAPVSLQIPREALFSQTSFRNMFLLALVISMGTTLFSCQNRTIGEVAVAQDTIVKDSTTGKVQAYKGNTLTCSKLGDTLAGEKFKLVELPPESEGTMLGEVAIDPARDTIASPPVQAIEAPEAKP